MRTELFLQTLGYFLLFTGASYSLGSYLVHGVGTRVLVGLGLIANLGLILGTNGQFTRNNLLLILIIIMITGWRRWPELGEKLVLRSKEVTGELRTDWLAGVVGLFALAVAGSLYLSAMAPPISTDELHYHFPQARALAESGQVGHSWDGHYFYGNIPKLGEVVFAMGLSISNYSLAHALNYLVMVGFLLIVFTIVRRRYGMRAGVFVTTLLLLFEDFTWNSTVGFVDSMTTAYEVGALLLVASWMERKKDRLLIVAGILLGLSLSVKYSPLPTALYLMVIILLTNWRKILLFTVPAFLTGGYWYIKNWLLFGNPFYPMYFGHRGVSEESYQGLMNAIWQWEPKTFATFMSKLRRWQTYSGSTTYLSIWLAPFALLIKKSDRFIIILTGYYLLFVPYWFFLATHQTRFLLTGLVVALILTGIVIAKLPGKLLWLGLVGLIGVSLYVRPYPERNLLEHYLWIKLHAVERQYALGNLSEDEMLVREFGCQYSMIKYLEDNKLEGNVVDNWSQYQAPSVNYYATNKLVNKRLVENLNDADNYYYERQSIKLKFLNDKSDPYFNNSSMGYLELEDYVVKNWGLLTEIDDCKLYRRPE